MFYQQLPYTSQKGKCLNKTFLLSGSLAYQLFQSFLFFESLKLQASLLKKETRFFCFQKLDIPITTPLVQQATPHGKQLSNSYFPFTTVDLV